MDCQLRLEAFLDINIQKLLVSSAHLLLLPCVCLVCSELYVLAQLNLNCQAEDSSLKFGIRNREGKVALKRMEFVLFVPFIHHRGAPRLACFIVLLLSFFPCFIILFQVHIYIFPSSQNSPVLWFYWRSCAKWELS